MIYETRQEQIYTTGHLKNNEWIGKQKKINIEKKRTKMKMLAIGL